MERILPLPQLPFLRLAPREPSILAPGVKGHPRPDDSSLGTPAAALRVYNPESHTSR